MPNLFDNMVSIAFPKAPWKLYHMVLTINHVEIWQLAVDFRAIEQTSTP